MALLQLAAACVPGIVPLRMLRSPSEFNPAASYLYGRFQTENSGPVRHTFMGLIIENGGKKIVIGLEPDKHRPKMFAVKPGRYTIKGILCGDNQLDIQLGAQSREFLVEPGKAYYIGEVQGQTVSMFDQAFYHMDQYKVGCELGDIQSAYHETTAALKERFPPLARMETVDVTQLP
jgi:hypothetical protein